MSRSPALTAYSSQYGTEGNWAGVIHSAVLALAPVAELANTRQQRLAANSGSPPTRATSLSGTSRRSRHIVAAHTSSSAEVVGRCHWHPAVATLRDDRRFDSIDNGLRGRAFRLLHALAREAEARGHSVRVPRHRIHGYVQDPSQLDGDLVFEVKDIACSVSL